jgi:hypothetical protein
MVNHTRAIDIASSSEVLTAYGSGKPTRDATLPVLTILLTICTVGIEKDQ